jgi:hypothetical protein
MNIIHDLYDNDSLDYSMITAYILYQAVGRADRTSEKKEIMMHTNSHTTAWGTHLGVSRARDTKSWSQQLRDRWAAHKAARQQATLDALHRCWDASREAVRPLRADAAIDMALAQGALSIATQPIALAV